MQVSAISPHSAMVIWGWEEEGPWEQVFTVFFSFFEGGEKGVENQAAWLRAFKQIKSCGKFIE